MTAAEYLDALAAAMEGLPSRDVRKTLEYYSELIADAVEAGQSEEEAVAGLPLPEEAADDLRPRRGASRRHGSIPAWAWIPIGAGVLFLLARVVVFGLGFFPVRSESTNTPEVSIFPSADDGAEGMQPSVRQFAASEIVNVEIDSAVFPLSIVAEERDDVELTLYERTDWQPDVMTDGETLHVSYPDNDLLHRSFDGGKCPITLRVPADFSADWDLDVDMGRLSVTGCAGTFELDAAMGAVTVEDCRADKLDVSADMGLITVQGCDADTLIVNSSMSGAEVRNTRGDTLTLTCGMGGVEVDELDFQTLTMTADMGSITGTLAGDRSEYNVSGNVDAGKSSLENGGGGPRSLTVSYGMGSIKLDFAE